jgi:hypothetical protein
MNKKKWLIITSDEPCNCCEKAIKLLKKLQANDEIYGFSIEKISNKNKNEINEKTKNYKYFPKIFDSDGVFIGGFTELQNLFEEENKNCIIL